jgi:serine/threonine-protein phosphatase 6 regulatory ankyrin repeat subunit B
LLLARGVSVDSIRGGFFRATSEGQVETTELLAGRITDRAAVASDALVAAAASSAGDARAAQIVSRLLAMGAEVERPDFNGRTALAWAAIQDHPAVAKLLIDAHAQVDRICPCSGYLHGNLTPLAIAAYVGHAATARVLLAAGADVNARRVDGMAPLALAAESSRQPLIELLLERGADPNARDWKGNPVLVIEARHVDAVRALIAHGADVNAKGKDGATALMAAAADGATDSLLALLDAGADLHARSEFGRTPLIVAVRNAEADAVRLLLARGARVADQDLEGKTALAHARDIDAGEASERRTRIIALLTHAGAR